MRSANCARTSYGVARLPYTSRLARCWIRARTGWNATATTAVAAIDSQKPTRAPCWATRAPRPTTIATYTAVMNAASDP